jgi:hypothetical protein
MAMYGKNKMNNLKMSPKKKTDKKMTKKEKFMAVLKAAKEKAAAKKGK